MKIFLKYQKFFFLLLIIICGVVILAPTHNFQPLLATGDHGRDLYAFQETLHGAKPYQDYWWTYGPVMPYYYALAFKILGISIQSVLIAEIFLKICAGLFFFLILSLFFSAGFAFLSSVWFLFFFPFFFHTYSYTAGITVQLIIIYFLASYLKSPRYYYSVAAIGACVFLSLIKINIGLFNLIAVIFSLFVIDRVKKNEAAGTKNYLGPLIASPIIVAAFYWMFFLKNLPGYTLRQCIPVFGNDQVPTASIFGTLFLFLKEQALLLHSGWINPLLAFLVVCLAFIFCFRKTKDKNAQTASADIFLFLGLLCIFMLFNFHEFLASGVFYRAIWIKPFQTLFIFTVIGAGLNRLQRPIPVLLCGTLFFLLFVSFVQKYTGLHFLKIPRQRLEFDKTSIYIANSPEWISTVEQTADYLKAHLFSKEKFFALPYDPLYCFLIGKTSPTRQTIFFDYIGIPPEQEKTIIADLEKERIRYVVLSNRHQAKESGLGTFGQTCCPLLGQYIFKNFEVVETFGDWQNEPGWAWNYGTKILRRK